MRFQYNGELLVAAEDKFYLGGKPEPGGLLDKFNQFSDKVVGAETEFVFAPLWNAIQTLCVQSWEWFVLNLPDILGYGAIATGIIIILSAMSGKGVLKPIGWFAGALIAGLCILGGV